MATYVDGNSVIVETKNKKVGKPQAAPTSSGVSQQAIDAMISGKAFDPYRQAATEAMARSTQQQRAAVAAQLSSRGMNNSGFGAQIARSTDSGIRQEGLQNRLNMDIAQENMKTQGIGMQQAQEQIAQQQQQLQIARDRLGFDTSNAEDLRKIERERLAQQGSLTRAQLAQEAELNRARLAQDAMLESNRNSLTREQLRIQKDLGLGDQQLRSRTLDIQEAQWQDELGLKREDFALRQQLGLEDLSLRSRALDAETQRAAKQLDLQFKELDQRDKQAMAQIQLGRDQLTSEDRRFMEQLGLSRDAQKWLEQYQKQSLSMNAGNRDIELGKLDLQNRQFQYTMASNPQNTRTSYLPQNTGDRNFLGESIQTLVPTQYNPYLTSDSMAQFGTPAPQPQQPELTPYQQWLRQGQK